MPVRTVLLASCRGFHLTQVDHRSAALALTVSCAYAKLTLLIVLIFLPSCRHGDRRRRRVSPGRLPVSKCPEDPDPDGELELSDVGAPPVRSGV